MRLEAWLGIESIDVDNGIDWERELDVEWELILPSLY